jgi:predicted metalloprotease with PDZ domain
LHLWIPNGLALSGDYDWFYEGFTVYQSMRLNVRLGHLNFQDYLDSLSRAYNTYLSLRDGDGLSVVDTSMRRWSGSAALIYNKGLLIAALYDLRIRQQSDGKRSLDDVYRLLFRRHKVGTATREGNDAVIDALNQVAGEPDFTKRFVKSVNRIDLTTLLAPYGLKVIRHATKTQIVIADSPGPAQRDLLRQMGYN